ncbi:MAG: hypothetical protein J6Z17_05975 [Treponema sp.]|nr:hypothetical protein [Treponema sp.]
MTHEKKSINDAWYAKEGAEQDVVISSRITLSRNLANFPFPSRLTPTDDEHIQAIVFNAFNHLENADMFNLIKISALDKTGFKIMCERQVLDENCSSSGALIMRNDGILSCSINNSDHVKLSFFSSGFNLDELKNNVYQVDSKLQENIQFAASYDFGYLNESLFDCGSGMKFSVRLHLPCLSFSSQIPELMQELEKDGLVLSGCFGAGGATVVSALGGKGSALGFYYELESKSSTCGSEIEQLSNIATWVKKIISMERTERKRCLKEQPCLVKNFIHRSVALARSSVFIKFREAVEIISAVKLGKELSLLTGIDSSSLHALLYRIQDGHLEYVLKSDTCSFEDDIVTDVQKCERLRSLILSEAFDDIILSV